MARNSRTLAGSLGPGVAVLAVLFATLTVACTRIAHKPDRENPVQDPQPRAIDTVVAEIRRELDSVRGRTGILAEKSLYSLFDEELIIRDFFQDRRDGFFVDVGCAWPIKASNTYYLEEHLGWRGIGVDAVEEFGPAWKKQRPRSKFFAYLVTDHSGTRDAFFKSPDTGLSSTSRRWASGEAFGESMEPEEVRVPAITLDELLEREGVTKIDLLSMDIEGHEAQALAGFDIERFRPELVVIEGWQGPVFEYLDRHGYELIERYRPFDKINGYFRRKDPGEPPSPRQ